MARGSPAFNASRPALIPGSRAFELAQQRDGCTARRHFLLPVQFGDASFLFLRGQSKFILPSGGLPGREAHLGQNGLRECFALPLKKTVAPSGDPQQSPSKKSAHSHSRLASRLSSASGDPGRGAIPLAILAFPGAKSEKKAWIRGSTAPSRDSVLTLQTCTAPYWPSGSESEAAVSICRFLPSTRCTNVLQSPARQNRSRRLTQKVRRWA